MNTDNITTMAFTRVCVLDISKISPDDEPAVFLRDARVWINDDQSWTSPNGIMNIPTRLLTRNTKVSFGTNNGEPMFLNLTENYKALTLWLHWHPTDWEGLKLKDFVPHYKK